MYFMRKRLEDFSIEELSNELARRGEVFFKEDTSLKERLNTQIKKILDTKTEIQEKVATVNLVSSLAIDSLLTLYKIYYNMEILLPKEVQNAITEAFYDLDDFSDHYLH